MSKLTSGSFTVSTSLTPVEAFALLRTQRGDIFLDSAMQLGPYGCRSRLFLAGEARLVARGNRVSVTWEGTTRTFFGDPFDELRRLLAACALPELEDAGGTRGAAAGYLGYDLGQLLETLPQTTVDDLGMPDLWLQFCPVVVTFDHETGECRVGWTALFGDEPQRAESLAEQLATAHPRSGDLPPCPIVTDTDVTSNFTHSEYVAAVSRIREYILAGDVYQVNLAQRFAAALTEDSWTAYCRLRSLNPAPFAAYFEPGPYQVLCASPERFLSYDPKSRIMQTRPIKGTRPRGVDPKGDAREAAALVTSAKDHAEHLMIVDLERNDLGRVARPGSVHVVEHAALETFPTVHHLTSTIEAELAVGKDPIDLLRATFPGGSITGAPKIRAMEIIDELEPTRRGLYTGALGYLGFDGALDLNIVIRTLIARRGRAYFHAGGGIVADSDPESEYEETLDKAQALFEALGVRK